MTAEPNLFKAIVIFDAQTMKQSKVAITDMLPFTKRRRLDRTAPEHHRDLLTCLTNSPDIRNWSGLKCYIMEFTDADIALQQVVHARLAGVGLIHSIRYDESVFNHEIAALAEFVMHASIISTSSHNTMLLLRQHTTQLITQFLSPQTTKEPHLFSVHSAIEINENCIEINDKIEDSLQHLTAIISQVLDNLDIR